MKNLTQINPKCFTQINCYEDYKIVKIKSSCSKGEHVHTWANNARCVKMISNFCGEEIKPLFFKQNYPSPPPPNQGNTTMSNTLSTLRALIVFPKEGKWEHDFNQAWTNNFLYKRKYNIQPNELCKNSKHTNKILIIVVWRHGNKPFGFSHL